MEAVQHKEGCMCDKCIQRRVIERKMKEANERFAEDYIKRRGGLDRPANKKI